MAKQSGLDKAIAALDDKINVLMAARAALVEQQQKKAPARRPKPVAVAKEQSA